MANVIWYDTSMGMMRPSIELRSTESVQRLYRHYTETGPSALARGILFPLIENLYGPRVRGEFDEDTRVQLIRNPATKPGRLFIANHIIDKDALMLAAFLRKLDFAQVLHNTVTVVSAGTFSQSLRGFAAHHMGAIPFFRRRDIYQKQERFLPLAQDECYKASRYHLEEGRNLLLFPEGVRRGNSRELPRFQKGLGHIALDDPELASQLEVWPIGLAYDSTFHEAAVMVREPFLARKWIHEDGRPERVGLVDYAETSVRVAEEQAALLLRNNR